MICAVVLAAGRSERMGTQKLLLPLGGKPVIARVVDELLGSPVDHVLVVVGRDGDQIRVAWATARFSLLRIRIPPVICSARSGADCGRCRLVARACWWRWAISPG